MRKNNNEKKGLKPMQIRFFALLGQEPPKPIPPKLVLIYGYPLSAMISQLLFWDGMGSRKDGLIFKTEKDFIGELGLSSAQQKLAIRKGKKFGFLTVVRKGIPAKRHYKLDYKMLVEKTLSEAENKGIFLTKIAYKQADNRPHKSGGNNPTITDITSETTARYHSTESTKDIISKRLKKE